MADGTRRPKRKFVEEWKNDDQFRDWLRDLEDPTRAFCTICKKEIGSQITTLKRHKVSNLKV